MSIDVGDEPPEMAIALAFDGVVDRLENPKEVIDGLSAWAQYVGVASEKPQHVINGFCAKRDIHIDFFPGPDSGKLETLERARDEIRLEAERYVFVGASRRDEVVAEKAGWDYLDFEEAAENAGWELA